MMPWYSTLVYLIYVNKKTIESLSNVEVYIYMPVTDPYAFMSTTLTPLVVFKFSGYYLHMKALVQEADI